MAKNHARFYHLIYFLSTYLVKLLREKGRERQKAESRRKRAEIRRKEGVCRGLQWSPQSGVQGEERKGDRQSRGQKAEEREARCLGRGGRRVREVEESKWLTLGRLPLEEERLGELGFAGNLERPEVLVPITLRNFGLRFYPKAQLIQVGESDGAVAHAIH
jgi:hypothetical protein